jgi:hypothetical protein
MKILILLLLLICTSCSTERIVSQKAYICYEIFPCGELVVHRFADLTLTEGVQYRFNSIKCSTGDTILIKDYKSKGVLGLFRKRLTTFTYYNNTIRN